MNPLTFKAKAALSLLALVVSCGLSFGAAWKYQGHKMEAKLATLGEAHKSALKAQSDKALSDYTKMEETKDEAIKTHKARADANANAAAAAKRTADGLRRDLAKVPNLIATATEAALREYAITSSELLGSCTAEYQRMADTAQRHAVDVLLLLESWPRNEPSKGDQQ